MAIRMVEPARPYSCSGCNRRFVRPDNRTAHQRRCPNIARKSKRKQFKPVSCQCCNEIFRSDSAYRHHLDKMSGSSWACDVCGQSFDNREARSRCKRKHRDVQDWTCCGRDFRAHTTFKNHVRNHEGIEYPCATCGSSFTKRNDLRNHEKTHNESKPKCEYCQKEFSRSSSVGRHQRHDCLALETIPRQRREDKKCEYCGCITSASNLQNHIDGMHLRLTTNCSKCQRQFFYSSSRLKHERKCSGLLGRRCSICPDKNYKLEGCLDKHMLEHEKKPFMCGICPSRLFGRKADLTRHHQTVHI